MTYPRKSGMTIAAACGIMLAAGVLTFRAQADEWDKKTILTIDQPIQVTDTYLEPGTYVFKLANSSSDRHIVYIYNRDQNHLINTVMAIPNYRLQPTGNSRFTFWETPPGTARAMRAWFYPGDNFGQEFRYPAHLRQLAAVTETRTVTETAQVTPPPAPVAEVAPPAPAPEVREEVKEETRTEIAQATPPPPAAVEEPAPPPPVEQPKELPKTASPYPLIGLCGLLSLGSYALLRIKRVA